MTADCILTLGAEQTVKLLDNDGYSIKTDERGAYALVLYNDTICELRMSHNLFDALAAAGAIAGVWYRISRNRQAAVRVYTVRPVDGPER